MLTVNFRKNNFDINFLKYLVLVRTSFGYDVTKTTVKTYSKVQKTRFKKVSKTNCTRVVLHTRQHIYQWTDLDNRNADNHEWTQNLDFADGTHQHSHSVCVCVCKKQDNLDDCTMPVGSRWAVPFINYIHPSSVTVLSKLIWKLSEVSVLQYLETI